MLTQNDTQKIWDLIKDIRFTMMASIEADTIHARPMTIVQKSFDGTIWLITRKGSHVSTEANGNSPVNLSFADIKNDTYVSLAGKATLSSDREKIKALWNPMVGAWFPEGKESDDIILLKIAVTSAEYWDVKSGKVTQLAKMAVAKAKNETPKIGEHETLA